MKREIGLESITHDPSSIVTVGTYDGVHRGHQAILEYVEARAREQDAQSVVISFDPHPRTVVKERDVPLLTTPQERGDILEELGVDRFVVVPFTKEFANQDPRSYVVDFLVGKVGLQEIVIGPDHRFGRERKGDRRLLEALGAEFGFRVDELPAQTVNASQVVSSTRIRELMTEEGDVRGAALMMGRNYFLSGTVVEGSKRGREIGFPTANIRPIDDRKAVPKRGVYAVEVRVEDEATLRPGMMNIGTRPTFGPDELHLEVHILNYERSIYGLELRVEFMRRLRDEKRFSSVEELIEQLSQDRDRCRDAI